MRRARILVWIFKCVIGSCNTAGINRLTWSLLCEYVPHIDSYLFFLSFGIWENRIFFQPDATETIIKLHGNHKNEKFIMIRILEYLLKAYTCRIESFTKYFIDSSIISFYSY